MSGNDVLMLRIALEDFKELFHGSWMKKTLWLIYYDRTWEVGGHDDIKNCEDLSNTGTACRERHREIAPAFSWIVRPNNDPYCVCPYYVYTNLLDLRKNA